MQIRKILNAIKILPIEDLAITQLILQGLPHHVKYNKNPREEVEQVLQALPKNVLALINAIKQHEIEVIQTIKTNFLHNQKNINDIGKDDVINELFIRMPDEFSFLAYEISIAACLLHGYIQASFGSNDVMMQEVIEPIKNLEESILAKRLFLSGASSQQQQIDDEVNEYVQLKRNKLGYLALLEQKKIFNNKIKKIFQKLEELKKTNNQENLEIKALISKLESEKKELISIRDEFLMEFSKLDSEIDVVNIYKQAQKKKNEIFQIAIAEEAIVRKEIEAQIQQAQASEKIKLLSKACDSYQNHLSTVIKTELERLGNQFVTNIMVAWPIKFFFSKKNNPQVVLRSGLDIAAEQATNDENAQKKRLLRKPFALVFAKQHQIINEPCKMALIKYQVITRLKAALADQTKLPTEKLKAFQKIFNENKILLQKRRDALTTLFLKIVASIFTLGLAAPYFWLWNKPKGVRFAESISQTLMAKNFARSKEINNARHTQPTLYLKGLG